MNAYRITRGINRSRTEIRTLYRRNEILTTEVDMGFVENIMRSINSMEVSLRNSILRDLNVRRQFLP